MTNSWYSKSRRLRGGAVLLALFAGLAWPADGTAQEPDETNAADSLRAEVADLRARLDSLSRVVRELRSAGEPAEAEEAEDELARLRAAAAEAAGDGGEEAGTADEGEEGQEGAFVGRQRSLQALNPEISVNVDVFGHLNTDEADRDNFIPREFEISFQSALDPFSRARIYVSHHVPGAEIEPFAAEGGHAHAEGGGFAVEEGYMEWVGLPGGVGVTVGKFFQRFGTLNRWHAHSLPFQSRSLPHTAYIGEESLSQTGVSVNWLLPVELGGTYETWLQVTRSGNEKLFGDSDRPSFLGHLNGFWQLTPALDLDLGVSGLFGEHRTEIESFDQRLYTVEGALTWRPPARSRYRELVLRGGWMLLDPSVPEEAHEPGGGEEEHEHAEFGGRAQGLWSMLDYKFSNQWRVGGRFDWAQDPSDPDRSAWLAGPTLTWWQSEWVRLRAEWDYMDDGAETLSQFLLQVTFAMGPHKHETY